MLFSNPNILPSIYQKRQSRYIDREFQLKYTVLFVACIISTLITIVGPLYYYWRQNNAIFTDMAFNSAPQLVEHLEREYVWIHIFLITGIVAASIFFFLMGVRATSKIIAPAKLMRNHLSLLSRGQWFTAPLKIRHNDEFQDLVQTYNYFYTCFKHNLVNETQKLEQLAIPPSNSTQYIIWKNLLDERYEQLNMIKKLTISNDEGMIESLDRRHVS